MKQLVTASLVLAFFVVEAEATGSGGHRTPAASGAPPVLAAYTSPPCRLFSTQHVARYAQRIYAGTDSVSAAERSHLRWEEGCLSDPSMLGWVRNYAAALAKRLAARIAALPQWQTAYQVSNYDDSPGTASGFHAAYGVAVCGSGGGPCVPFGTRIEFRYNGQDVIAVADDHGPYVGGRWFDLGGSTADALGFQGVADMQYRILSGGGP